MNYYSETLAQRKATTEDIEQFVALNDKLIKIYNNCNEIMNANILSSSFELKQFCSIPIAQELDSIYKFVQKTSLSIDAKAYDSMRRMIDIMQKDYRQGLIAVAQNNNLILCILICYLILATRSINYSRLNYWSMVTVSLIVQSLPM